jgi:hypothetical protein
MPLKRSAQGIAGWSGLFFLSLLGWWYSHAVVRGLQAGEGATCQRIYPQGHGANAQVAPARVHAEKPYLSAANAATGQERASFVLRLTSTVVRG